MDKSINLEMIINFEREENGEICLEKFCGNEKLVDERSV